MEKYSQALKDFLQTASPESWHQVVWNWTWDYDFSLLEWVANQKKCDIGTVKLVYWIVYDRIDGLWKKDKPVKDLVEFDQRYYKLMQNIEKKLGTGFYNSQLIGFDPRKDKHCDKCEPWVAIYKGGYQNHQIPKIMFDPVNGKKLTKAELDGGLPDEVVNMVVERDKQDAKKNLSKLKGIKIGNRADSYRPAYWIYQTEYQVYGVQYIRAKLITPSRYQDNKFYYGEGRDETWIKSSQQYEPYGVDLKLTYQVNPKHQHPDNYAASHGFTLFSERLIQLMEEFGVNSEKFPVKIVDKQGEELMDLKYFVFHSFEKVLPAMDEQKSKWIDRDQGIPSLVLDLNYFEHRPIFLCNHLYIHLMRDDLKQEINQRSITGFGFLDPAKYKSGSFGIATDFND